MKYLSTLEEEPTTYRAFIIRWWIEGMAGDGNEWQWRFLVEDIHDRQSRRGFNSFNELVLFLQTEVAKSSEDLLPNIVFEPVQDNAEN